MRERVGARGGAAVVVRELKAVLALLRPLALGAGLLSVVVRVRAGRPPRDGRHALLAPPGRGNIGDVALVEAFVDQVRGPVTVVVDRVDDFAPFERDDVRVVAVPGLVHGRYTDLRAVWRFAAALADARTFSVVGADMMDGGYRPVASAQRSLLVAAAAASGRHSRILGFSWNGRAEPLARRALLRAARRGVVVLARDPRSRERLLADGVRGVVATSDMVFAQSRPAPDETERVRRDRGVPRGAYAVVNVSGLLARRTHVADGMVEVVEHLLSRGLDVVLLAHVGRATADDRAACAAVAERVTLPGVHWSPLLPTPREVRALAAGADVVVTGRMHLAVMALMSGTPAVTLASQGKVEGLAELFGAAQLAVTPEPGFARQVVEVVDGTLDDLPRVRGRLLDRSARVRQLSAANFEGLTSAAGALTTRV